MTAAFQLFTGKDGQFCFHLRAANNEIILKSEGYRTRENRLAGIQSVRNNASDRLRYTTRTAANGQYYFNLLAENEQIIGTSELYTTAMACENGIDAVMNAAPHARIT